MEPIFALGVTVSKDSGGLLRSVHAQLRAAIQDGRLQPGLQLPPSRKLAQELGISRNTAVAAYDLLMSEGYLEARRGAGTYVSLARAVFRTHAARSSRGKPPELSEFWRDPPAAFGERGDGYRYNFGIGEPDLSLFPSATWRRLANRALRSSSRDISPADPQGRAALRAAIAKHVSFTRAIACEPDDIIVTAGSQQAFDLLARVLVTPQRTMVALEEPHYPPMRHVFRSIGARLVTTPVDEQGIVVERISTKARVVCVTPSHQFPLGSPLSLERRVALLEFARRHGASILEDDYDGEFRFSGRPLDALKTLDRDERVFYVGTFSKSLFPALRVGYIIAPPWARAALVAAKHLTDRHGALLTQDTLATFMAEGYLVRHVRKMTRIYAERRVALLTALERHCAGQLLPIPSEAGLHIAAKLLVPTLASTILAHATEASIKVQALSQFSSARAPLNGLAFGYGAIAAEDIATGVRLLAATITRASRKISARR